MHPHSRVSGAKPATRPGGHRTKVAHLPAGVGRYDGLLEALEGRGGGKLESLGIHVHVAVSSLVPSLQKMSHALIGTHLHIGLSTLVPSLQTMSHRLIGMHVHVVGLS